MLKIINIGTYRNHGQPKQCNPQIFDLLQLSKKEREFKLACRQAIRKFSGWKKSQQKTADMSSKLSMQVEGILLRRQAQDAIILYRLTRQHRIQEFQTYIARLPAQKSLFRMSS